MKAGVEPPSVKTLRSWKKAITGISEDALDVLRYLSQSDDTGIDAEVISLNFLKTKFFIDLKAEPGVQALVLHHAARYTNQ